MLHWIEHAQASQEKDSMKIHHSEIPGSFLVSVSLMECNSIEYLSSSVPDLVSFLATNWVAFYSVGF